MTIDLLGDLDDDVIKHELGRGATGHVYLAEDAILGRQVVVSSSRTPTR